MLKGDVVLCRVNLQGRKIIAYLPLASGRCRVGYQVCLCLVCLYARFYAPYLAEKLLMILSLHVQPPQNKATIGAPNVCHKNHVFVTLQSSSASAAFQRNSVQHLRLQMATESRRNIGCYRFTPRPWTRQLTSLTCDQVALLMSLAVQLMLIRCW